MGIREILGCLWFDIIDMMKTDKFIISCWILISALMALSANNLFMVAICAVTYVFNAMMLASELNKRKMKNKR